MKKGIQIDTKKKVAANLIRQIFVDDYNMNINGIDIFE